LRTSRILSATESIENGISGIQDDVGAAGDAGRQRDVAGVKSHRQRCRADRVSVASHGASDEADGARRSGGPATPGWMVLDVMAGRRPHRAGRPHRRRRRRHLIPEIPFSIDSVADKIPPDVRQDRPQLRAGVWSPRR